MSPKSARYIAFGILIIGVAGILLLYYQLDTSIEREQERTLQVQRNVFNQLLETLSLEAKAYEVEARPQLAQLTSGKTTQALPRPAALIRGDIDGVMVVNQTLDPVYTEGTPISSADFGYCLRANSTPSGIHTCPVSKHTVIYSIVERRTPAGIPYSVVFYREVLPELEGQITRISGSPVRFVQLTEPVPDLAGHGHLEQALENVNGDPLVKMASYFPLTTRNWSRVFFGVTVVIIGLLVVLEWMLVGFSKTAELTRKIEAKNAELEQLTSQKESLLRILCHDLNNYLTVILGNSQLLGMSKSMNDRQATLNSRIQAAAHMQQQIIERIRQQKALEEGKSTCNPEPIRLAGLLKQVRHDFALRLQEQDLTLDILSDSDDLIVMVDPVTFSSSVLNNLISNAIKFSPHGSTITLRAKRLDDQRLRLSVEDQGIGIPPALMKSIWDPSMQTSRPGLRGEQGTGFGMPLVKEIVEGCGGTITIESRDRETQPQNHGTSIHLDLRLAV